MIGLVLIVSLCVNTATENISAPRELYQTRVDSFEYHYRIIDSILNRNAYDTSELMRG